MATRRADVWRKLKPRILTVSKSWDEAYGLFLKGEAPLVLSYTTSPAYHIIEEKKTAICRRRISPKASICRSRSRAITAHAPHPELCPQVPGLHDHAASSRTRFRTTNWMYPGDCDVTGGLPSAFPVAAEEEPADRAGGCRRPSQGLDRRVARGDERIGIRLALP